MSIPSHNSGPAAIPTAPTLTLAEQQTSEIRAAEDESLDGPDPDISLAGVLAYAVIPAGRSLLGGLLELAEDMLYITERMPGGSTMVPAPTRAAFRFIAAAREIHRREVEARAARYKRAVDETTGGTRPASPAGAR